jgi:dTDP-4-amino-4,6-dideoxygalactose transaminase
LAHLGYKAGAFPVTDKHAQTMISFPMHQHHTPEQMQYVVDVVNKFYK